MVDHMEGVSGWMQGMGTGMMGFGVLFAALLVILAFLGVAVLLRGMGTMGGPPDRESDDPLAILKRRYAAGEIDADTYRRMRQDLEA